MSELGDKLRQARMASNLTQQQASEVTGIGYKTINDYENGKSRPDVEKLALLCYAYNTPADYFIKVNLGQNKAPITPMENQLLQKYRQLDTYGKRTTDVVIDIELERVNDLKSSDAQQSSKVAYMRDYAEKKRTRRIPLYALSAGAGNGVFLDSNDYELIDITLDSMSEQATFAVRVSGDSMEPKYSTGDILLVKTQPEVEIGELGIFILNGEGFFKKYGGDHLISFNDAYSDIVFKEYDDISCKGKVLGALEED